MNALIFIDHDIMVRHFIDSGVFNSFRRTHEITLVVPTDKKRVKRELTSETVGFDVVELPTDGKRQFLWQTLFQVTQVRLHWGRHGRGIRGVYRAVLPKKVLFLYTLLGLPGIYGVFKYWLQRALRRRPCAAIERLIDESKPDVIIHPSVLSGVYINDLTEIARARGLPLVVIMNSWDNPCTKRVMVGAPDWLLVWGEQTKRHAIDYIGMRPGRVVKFGAAQFDVYRRPIRITRREFCQRHGIDPERTILLYAGSSKGTDEFTHLVEIDRAISDGRISDVVVVYRPHPWGGGGKDGGRILDHPWQNVRIESTMRDYLDAVRKGGHVASYPDYRDTHDVLSSVDVVVSPLSTIILEGALHGKPTLCFLPMEETAARHFQFAVPLIHFDDIFEMPEFLVARGNAELITGIEALLGRVGDAEYGARLEKACGFFVESFDRPYDERLVEFIEGVAKTAS